MHLQKYKKDVHLKKNAKEWLGRRCNLACIVMLDSLRQMIDTIGIDTASLENVLWKQIMAFVNLQVMFQMSLRCTVDRVSR